MKTRSITGDTARNRIRDDDIRNICEIRDVVKWARIGTRAWRDHVKETDDNLAEIAKNGKPDTPCETVRELDINIAQEDRHTG